MDLKEFEKVDPSFYSQIANLQTAPINQFKFVEQPQIDPKSTIGYKMSQQNEALNKLLEETKKQNDILQKQLEFEKNEKKGAIIAAKKNKRWSIAGKILAAVISFFVFVIPIIVSLYPDKCIEIIESVIK